jgi:hypothetical protein
MGLFSKFLLAGRKSLNSFMCGAGVRAAAGTRGAQALSLECGLLENCMVG